MIDIEKFICSLLADHPEGITVRNDIHKALKEQGLEYKDGKIVPIENKTELKESDERIRKGIIRNLEYLLDRAEGFVKDELKERIAWLKKQGENTTGISEVTKQKLDDNLSKALEKETSESWNEFLDDQYDQKHEWSEEDEKIVEVLNDYVKNLDLFFSEIKIDNKDILSKEFREKVQHWLKTLKDRVQPRPKQEWTEEDENGLGDALWAIKQARTIAKNENEMGGLWYAERWLNTIKDRIQ